VSDRGAFKGQRSGQLRPYGLMPESSRSVALSTHSGPSILS